MHKKSSWNRLAAFLTTFILLMGACQTEPDDTAQRILGRWALTEATRNGQVAESLQDLYFEFLSNNQLNTNISGVPETAAYTIDKKTIQQRQSRIEADYTIEEINDSVLVLSANIRNIAFQFKLARNQGE